MQKKDSFNIAAKHSRTECSSKGCKTFNMRSYFVALLLLLLSFGLMPKQINATIVGTAAQTPTIDVFADVTWTVLSSNTKHCRVLLY